MFIDIAHKKLHAGLISIELVHQYLRLYHGRNIYLWSKALSLSFHLSITFSVINPWHILPLTRRFSCKRLTISKVPSDWAAWYPFYFIFYQHLVILARFLMMLMVFCTLCFPEKMLVVYIDPTVSAFFFNSVAIFYHHCEFFLCIAVSFVSLSVPLHISNQATYLKQSFFSS